MGTTSKHASSLSSIIDAMSEMRETNGVLFTEIDRQLAEKRAEVEVLESARAELATAVSEMFNGVTAVDNDEDTPEPQPSVKAQRIANLKKAREAKAAKNGGTSDKPAQIVALLESGKSVAEIAEELEISKGYVYNVRNRMPKTSKQSAKAKKAQAADLKDQRIANLQKAREAKAAKSGGKVTKAKQIERLLNKDMSVADVAEKLGISKVYVYNVRSRMAA